MARIGDQNCPSDSDLIGSHEVRTGSEEQKKGTQGCRPQWGRFNDRERGACTGKLLWAGLVGLGRGGNGKSREGVV